MNKDRIEVRWHGRGGHGAVTGAMILAEAAFIEGYRGVTAAPFFGAERRGAPVIATNRLGRNIIRTFSPVTEPDIVIVLDESIMDLVDVSSGLKPDGIIIINSSKPPEGFAIAEHFDVATCDAFHCAIEAGLVVAGTVLFNTPILGGVSRATGLISMESIKKALQNHFNGDRAEKNFMGAQLAYEKTRLLRRCMHACC